MTRQPRDTDQETFDVGGGRVSTRRPRGGGAGPHLLGRGYAISYVMSRQKGSSHVFQWLMGTFPVAPETFLLVGKVERARFCLHGFSQLVHERTCSWRVVLCPDERRIKDDWTRWPGRCATAGGLELRLHVIEQVSLQQLRTPEDWR